jgi:HemY protein
MIRLAAFLGFCVVASFIANWLSAQQGVTVVNWLGWRIEVMTSLLVAGLIISLSCLLLMFRLLVSIISWPSWLGHNWRVRRRRRGDDALGQGMVAFAAGDMAEARKLARRAERLLGSGVLPDLLSAQTAHATGDDRAALRYFKSLSSQLSTAYFGHLGLMRLHLAKGETEKSCIAARAALAIKADSSPANLVLLAEDLNREKWKSALDRLEGELSSKNNLFTNGSGQSSPLPLLSQDTAQFAVGQLNNPNLLAAHLCLRLSEQQTNDMGRQTYLVKALDWFPSFLEAIIRLASLEAASSPRKALKRLEAAFKRVPHQRLANLIADVAKDNDGHFIARLSGLAEQAVDKDEARLIVAEAALNRGIWASASSALHSVSEKGQSNQYFLLNAELANKRAKSLGQALDDKSIAAREGALLAAAHAPRARRWQCGGCATTVPQWQMICPSCNVMGQIDLLAPPVATQTG